MVRRVLVRAVHARRAEHVALGGAADDERAATAHDLGRLAQDHLDDTRVTAVGGPLQRRGRGLDLREVNDPPLGLRNRLLRHDERVAVSERLSGVGDRTKQERSEIVAWADTHRERDGDDADHASTAAATPARTAGSFSSVGTTIARIASASRSSASPASSGSSTYAPASGWR